MANAGSAAVTYIELDSTVTQTLECHCRVTGLYPLSGAAVFRLNELSSEPVKLFDGSGEAPRILFVATEPQPEQRN